MQLLFVLLVYLLVLWLEIGTASAAAAIVGRVHWLFHALSELQIWTLGLLMNLTGQALGSVPGNPRSQTSHLQHCICGAKRPDFEDPMRNMADVSFHLAANATWFC